MSLRYFIIVGLGLGLVVIAACVGVYVEVFQDQGEDNSAGKDPGRGNTPGGDNGEGPIDPAPGPGPGVTNHKHSNGLINESSPYLLQHAHNPVDWMPWGDEAFAKAKAENKPVFLSIGYATCHWCHVMERESFENEEIAKLLNELFVCIKVDREERPDIDAIYMDYCNLITRRGGWPLTVWLLPDRRPFYVATYLPPRDMMQRRGLPSVSRWLGEMWRTDKERMVEAAEDAGTWLKNRGAPSGNTSLGESIFEEFFKDRAREFDDLNGGFGSAPKFPLPHGMSALLRIHQTSGGAKVRVRTGGPLVKIGPEALRMVEETLQKMVRGGIFDQLGGGYHRYSTDSEWLVPHFEKMLYNQALLTEAYLDAYQITGNEQYAETTRRILDYVLRDLRDEAGGFHSAEDADSEGVEGKFYVWSVKEMKEILGAEAALAIEVYSCTEAGNFMDEMTRAPTGENILHLSQPLEMTAADLGISLDDLKAKLESVRKRLFEVRSKRVRPLLDDKVLTDWNGLMIGAMARAGAVLNEPRYLTAATEAATFLRDKLVKNGRLLHRYRKGNAGINGYASDYAFLANGLFELYQATFDAQWLQESQRLVNEMIRLFFHEEDGLLHLTGRDDESDLIAPTREKYDGALPSSNSVGAFVLMRVGKLTQSIALTQNAERILQAMSLEIERHPPSYSYALRALDMIVHPAQEIVISGPRDSEATRAMIAELRRSFLPRAVIALHEPGGAGRAIEALAPFISGQEMVDGKPAAYVCENYTCLAPVTTAEDLKKALESAGG